MSRREAKEKIEKWIERKINRRRKESSSPSMLMYLILQVDVYIGSNRYQELDKLNMAMF